MLHSLRYALESKVREMAEKFLYVLMVEKLQYQVCFMLYMYIFAFPLLSQHSKFTDAVCKKLDSTNKYYLGKCSWQFHLKIGVIYQEGISV